LYDEISIFGFSKSGDHLAYLARTDKKTVLNMDGVEHPVIKYDSAFEIAISDAGRVLYSALINNKVRAFLDRKIIKGAYNGVYSLNFSSDGSNYVFTAEEGDKSVLIINGQETQTFDKIVNPTFAPDGSKIIYRARNKGERFVAVSDLHGNIVREHPHYEAVWEVYYSPDGEHVGYGVMTGQELWWKVEPLYN